LRAPLGALPLFILIVLTSRIAIMSNGWGKLLSLSTELKAIELDRRIVLFGAYFVAILKDGGRTKEEAMEVLAKFMVVARRDGFIKTVHRSVAYEMGILYLTLDHPLWEDPICKKAMRMCALFMLDGKTAIQLPELVLVRAQTIAKQKYMTRLWALLPIVEHPVSSENVLTVDE
jgi:hypothetical protein